MDLFRCSSLISWDLSSIQSIRCKSSLGRVKALLLKISLGKQSGNQKQFSPSYAPNFSPPLLPPRHWKQHVSISPSLGSKSQMLRTEIEIESRGKQRFVPSPQLSLPLRPLPGRSQPGGLWQPMHNPAGAPRRAPGQAVRRAVEAAAGSASPPSPANPALPLRPQPQSYTRNKQWNARNEVQRAADRGTDRCEDYQTGVRSSYRHYPPCCWLQTATSSSSILI